MESQTFGRYRVRHELGRGGMAIVYLAHDPLIGREVAIKVLPRQFTFDPQFEARFQREVRAIATLEHGAIVPVYDFGEFEGQPYIVMRYMSGGSLAARLRLGRLPLSEAARILDRIAPALDRAHAHGIVHRDLKPGNILFDQDGEAYLSDFGIAKLADTTAAYTGSALIGTPAYMSPEQARGESAVDGRSDVYSLGVILFEMLAGRPPYSADTPMGIAMRHLTDPVPRIRKIDPGLPKSLERVVRRALAKAPDNRHGTAAALASALAGCLPHPGEARPGWTPPVLSDTLAGRQIIGEAGAGPGQAGGPGRPPAQGPGAEGVGAGRAASGRLEGSPAVGEEAARLRSGSPRLRISRAGLIAGIVIGFVVVGGAFAAAGLGGGSTPTPTPAFAAGATALPPNTPRATLPPTESPTGLASATAEPLGTPTPTPSPPAQPTTVPAATEAPPPPAPTPLPTDTPVPTPTDTEVPEVTPDPTCPPPEFICEPF